MLNDNDYIKTIYESQTFGLYMPVKVQVFCCYKSLPYPCCFFYPRNFDWTFSFLVVHMNNIAV